MDKKLPKGLDQQGRYPEAAEACTDIGADADPLRDDMLESVTKVVILAIGVVAAGVITISLLANL
jgi:hypothetical protein